MGGSSRNSASSREGSPRETSAASSRADDRVARRNGRSVGALMQAPVIIAPRLGALELGPSYHWGPFLSKRVSRPSRIYSTDVRLKLSLILSVLLQIEICSSGICTRRHACSIPLHLVRKSRLSLVPAGGQRAQVALDSRRWPEML